MHGWVGWLVTVKPWQSNLLYCKQRFQFCMLYTHTICSGEMQRQCWWREGWVSVNEAITIFPCIRTLLMHVVGAFLKTTFSWHILICRIHIKNYMSYKTQNSIWAERVKLTFCALFSDGGAAVNSLIDFQFNNEF
jgi:hypothetical protein